MRIFRQFTTVLLALTLLSGVSFADTSQTTDMSWVDALITQMQPAEAVVDVDFFAEPEVEIYYADDFQAATCYTCSKSTTGQCAPQKGKVRVQCHGSRAGCQKKGCKITSYGSCTNAANVGNC